MNNIVKIQFGANLQNQGLARSFVAAYLVPLDPMVEELTEVKTAISEAVGNAIIHGYAQDESKIVEVELNRTDKGQIIIVVRDKGKGIENIEQAMEPLFTTSSSEDCSGMGFTVMESFMDKVIVTSKEGQGTTVKLVKQLDISYE